MLRAAAVALVLAAGLVAACGGGGPADGWVSVGTGDTYGEWELFAEVEDGAWTGCLRFDDLPEECGDPADELVLFEEEFDGVQYGAVRDGVELEFVEGGDTVGLMEPDGIDHDFFVVADSDIRVKG